ncbi:hypothetical protein PO124_09145 [Bacillus licheniformis]|nr:hypothetical protein [Bacillus licheniformis]
MEQIIIFLRKSDHRFIEKVIQTGKVMKVKSRDEIECAHRSCPLQAAIVLPLFSNRETIGTLKLYFKHPSGLNRVTEELAEGLAMLFHSARTR